MKSIEEKFNNICKAIPTYALSDEIGLDTETAYVLDLWTEEKYKTANEYLTSVCTAFIPIHKRYIGKKVIIEMDTNGGDARWWFCNHGTMEEYFADAKITLERYMSNIEW